MKKILWILGIFCFIQMLALVGVIFSFKVAGIVLGSILGLALLGIPTVVRFFMFKKYNLLRAAFDKFFAFYMSILLLLIKVDLMLITDLQIVNLKDKILKIRAAMDNLKRRRQSNAS